MSKKRYAVVDEMGFMLSGNTHGKMKTARQEAQRLANHFKHDVVIDAALYNEDLSEIQRILPAVAIVHPMSTKTRRSR